MKLKDIIEKTISGDWGNEQYLDETPCAICCVRGADIVPIENSNFDGIPKRYVSEKSLKSRALEVGDIVIEKSGGSPTQSTGRVSYISEALIKCKSHVLCSNFCCAIRIKKVWNPKFVYYFWKYTYSVGVFFNFEGKTSGLKNLQLDNALNSIEIPDFPKTMQDSIVETLSKIETKIALNREINRNLEAMARQLYDYWFVQFDFPDENGKPYKSSGGKMVWNEKIKREIPEGWKIVSLPTIATFTNGLACQKFRPKSEDEKLPVIKIREMRDGITSESEWVAADIPDAVKVYDGDILFSWSASLEVMIWTGGEGGLNQHIFKVEPKSYYPKAFVYIQILDYISVFKGIAEARKTTMGHITQDHLNQSQIVIPASKSILQAFENTISPIVNLFVKLSQQSKQLMRQRDKLLPLLMNGQVSVMPREINCDLSRYQQKFY